MVPRTAYGTGRAEYEALIRHSSARPSDSSDALTRKNDCKRTHTRSRVRFRRPPKIPPSTDIWIRLAFAQFEHPFIFLGLFFANVGNSAAGGARLGAKGFTQNMAPSNEPEGTDFVS